MEGIKRQSLGCCRATKLRIPIKRQIAKHMVGFYWARSHFSRIPKCDMFLNNICEKINKCILDAREKPIIGLLEGL